MLALLLAASLAPLAPLAPTSFAFDPPRFHSTATPASPSLVWGGETAPNAWAAHSRWKTLGLLDDPASKDARELLAANHLRRGSYLPPR